MKTKKDLKIGSLSLPANHMLAPMAGITNLPMRLISRQHGAPFAFTEMISVNGLVREGKKTLELLHTSPADRPLGIQLFGDDPFLLAEGARMVEEAGDLIDINMGCPVRKVVNSGAGSGLLRDLTKISRIIREVRKATNLPLTVKIRSGWGTDNTNYLEAGKIALDEGCDAITLHPRTRSQMFEGKADWEQIGLLKESLSIPVIGSGDLFTAGDAVAMLGSTGCDGVMIARGALGNPWVFSQIRDLLAGSEDAAPSPADRLGTVLHHFQLFCQTVGERTALLEMRKHACWYAKGLPGAARFRDEVNHLNSRDGFVDSLHRFFQTGQP